GCVRIRESRPGGCRAESRPSLPREVGGVPGRRPGETSHVRKESSGRFEAGPGNLLSVQLTMAETTVKDAHQAVGEGAQRLPMGLPASSEPARVGGGPRGA